MAAGDLIGTVILTGGHRVSVHDDGDEGRSITRHVVGMTVRMSFDVHQVAQLVDLLAARSDFGDELDDLTEGKGDER